MDTTTNWWKIQKLGQVCSSSKTTEHVWLKYASILLLASIQYQGHAA